MADSASFISQLNVALPGDSATFSQAAVQWQHIKRTIQSTFNNLNDEMSASAGELNALNGLTSGLQTQINSLRLTSIDGLSANFASSLSSMAATLSSNKLSASQTAINSILWDGAERYVQSDTPAGAAEGAVWFQI